MEIQLQNYYEDYKKIDRDGNYGYQWNQPTFLNPDYYSGYVCPTCGQWIPYNTAHICHQWPSFYYLDKTGQAYAILKKFVENKIVTEPRSYKEFCDLLDGIKEAL